MSTTLAFEPAWLTRAYSTETESSEVNAFGVGEGVGAKDPGGEGLIVFGEVSCVASAVIGFGDVEGMRPISGIVW